MLNLTYIWEITLSALALVELAILVLGIPWILTIKRDSVSAVAWCLVVVLLPIIGFLLFTVFGYNYVHRPLKRKRKHRAGFGARNPAEKEEAQVGYAPNKADDGTYKGLGRLATQLGAFPVSHGNEVTFHADGQKAFDDMFEVMESAEHHLHLEFFIIHADELGGRVVDLLERKAKAGVEVRLLYDAVGSFRFRRRLIRRLHDAGGKAAPFLPINPLRRRIQFNLRNHRKITVVDGRVAFTGGLNIGNEYVSKDAQFGYWRDQHLRLEGPAVAALQRIFIEDWDFATGENLRGEKYFPRLPPVGDAVVQIVASGPDQEQNAFRELIFAAVSVARERLWIATPYFVPDGGIIDALRLVKRMGVDVRVLFPLRPDHWLTHYAGCYLIGDLLPEGIRFYQYARGMMHAKFLMTDGRWAYVGSSNFDNRSLHLNFEANCVVHSPPLIAELEQTFLKDLEDSILLEPEVFARRPFSTRIIENCCRLFSPVL